MIVFGGAPKVGKSDFLLSWLTHMAAGEPFLELTPSANNLLVTPHLDH
jgi:predicted ATP-dependent serine protease